MFAKYTNQITDEIKINHEATQELQVIPNGQTGFIRVPANSAKKSNHRVCVHWYKDGNLYKVIKSTYFQTFDLTFYKAKADAYLEGTYQLQLRGRANDCSENGERSKEIKLVIGETPVFVETPKSVYNVRTGDSVTIKCKAIGVPEAKQNWIKVYFTTL